MIRMSKLADYGVVIMATMARERQPLDATVNARDLSEKAHIPLPTVGKILKALCRGGLLVSHRGPRGGYALARLASEITVLDIISILDGPVGLTDCTVAPLGACEMEATCPVRSPWHMINRRVLDALRGLTLHEMIDSTNILDKRP